jgi:hypothetical protein
MGNMFYQIGLALMQVGIKRLLLGAGLGLVSYKALSNIFDNMISNAIANMQGGSDIALSFLGLSGMDTALSIVISAALVRVTIASSQLHLARS